MRAHVRACVYVSSLLFFFLGGGGRGGCYDTQLIASLIARDD